MIKKQGEIHMLFAEKNNDGIELHLTKEERELLFNTLRYYSAYVNPDNYFIQHTGKICEILNVLHLSEFDKNEYSKGKTTNIDRIRIMPTEQVAEFMYGAADKICFENCTKDTNNKFSCKFGEDVDPNNCINCMKAWLNRECDEQ